MNKRTYLKKGDKLRLMRGQHSWDEWKILGIVGEGGSSVCYQASCGAKVGRLKEFYPAANSAGAGKQRSVILKRDPDGQLQPFSDSMQERFLEMRRDFVSAYEKLEKIQAKTFVIGGELDRTLGAKASKELAEKIPGCTLKMYSQYGHALYDEAKDFQQIVYDFLLGE